MMLHKTHSRMDLIDIINTLDIPIIFSHDDNKKSIHSKVILLLNLIRMFIKLLINGIYNYIYKIQILKSLYL